MIFVRGQPDSVVEWMRSGRWTKQINYGEGSMTAPGFPPMPPWFKDNRDFGAISKGLCAAGINQDEVDGIMGGNWLRFFRQSFDARPNSARQKASAAE